MNAPLPTLCSALLLFLSDSAHAQNWLQFRGPNGSAVSPQTDLPCRLTDAHIAWKKPLPGRGLSSPLVIGERLYLTASSGPDQDRLHVLCLNAATGETLWERQFWATGRTMTFPKISVATCTPCSDTKRLVATFSSNDVVCLDLEGNLIWFRGLTRDYPNASNSLGMASSPTLFEDIAIFSVESDSESFAIALSLEDGSNRWKIPRPKISNWCSPILAAAEGGRPLVSLMSMSGVSFVDPKTGQEQGRFESSGCSTMSSITAANGTLFIPAKGTTALRLKAHSAQPEVLWQNAQMVNSTVSPVVLKERVYTLNNAGILKCSHAKDGEKIWQLRTTGPYSATPVAAGDTLYLVNEKGLLQTVDTTAPEGAILSSLDLKDTFIGTPSIGSGALYLRSDRFLYRVSEPAKKRTP